MLHKNYIGDYGAYFIAHYLNRQKNFSVYPGGDSQNSNLTLFLRDLHLSDNRITQNGLRRLLEGLDEAFQYPILQLDHGNGNSNGSKSSGKVWPLWLRINNNYIHSPVEFLGQIEQMVFERREKAKRVNCQIRG